MPQKRKFKIPLDLSPEAQKNMWGVLLIFIAIFFTLSLLNLTGKIGQGLSHILILFFGLGSWIIIILFFLLGFIFFFSERPSPYLSTIIGSGLALVSLFSILELSSEDSGGILGKFLASGPKNFLGIVGSWVVFIFLFLISLPLLFNAPIFSFLFNTLILKIKKIRQKEAPKEVLKEGEIKVKMKEISPEIKEREEPTKVFPKFAKKVQRQVKYKALPLTLLESERENAIAGNLKANAQIIKKTLKNFEIDVEMGEINVGPTVTQYTLKPAEGVKLSRILVLQKDLSLALAAHPIRIEAPIPGKSLVGIEVPNQKRALVRLKSLLFSPDFVSLGSLFFPVGKDVMGNPYFTDLGSMPHLLVAGATGTGKTIFLNSLILSLLWRNSPQSVRFVLIDPKRVEFIPYTPLPHLLGSPITRHDKVIQALKFLVEEMERRFGILHETKSRDIRSYNFKIKSGKEKGVPLPYIIFVVDELADIMAAKGKEFEAGIIRLAQMSRAVGIHLVLATQRPSVEVLTGLIKANITSRVAFQVASQVDSRTILDMAGAERLLGKGDMLFLSTQAAKPRRYQAAYISLKEIKRVVDHIKKTEEKIETELDKHFKEIVEEPLEKESEILEFKEEDEELYQEAKKVVIRARKASASLLQRRLKIGYARAARILDMLEERGVVGPSKGAKPRDVYIKEDENLENLNFYEKK